MTRYTFVIQVHPDGISTLENLATRERIRIVDFAAVGPQVEAWLSGLGPQAPPNAGAGPEPADGPGRHIRP